MALRSPFDRGGNEVDSNPRIFLGVVIIGFSPFVLDNAKSSQIYGLPGAELDSRKQMLVP